MVKVSSKPERTKNILRVRNNIPRRPIEDLTFKNQMDNLQPWIKDIYAQAKKTNPVFTKPLSPTSLYNDKSHEPISDWSAKTNQDYYNNLLDLELDWGSLAGWEGNKSSLFIPVDRRSYLLTNIKKYNNRIRENDITKLTFERKKEMHFYNMLISFDVEKFRYDNKTFSSLEFSNGIRAKISLTQKEKILKLEGKNSKFEIEARWTQSAKNGIRLIATLVKSINIIELTD